MRWITKYIECSLIKEEIAVDKTLLVNDEEYVTLAKKLGLRQILTARKNVSRLEQFKAFLAENGITVYPEQAVNRYMRSILSSGQEWDWRNTEAETTMRGWKRMPPYDKPIPYEVLLVMEKIRTAYPEATFQITDIIHVPKGDPFLRVGLTKTDNYNSSGSISSVEEWFIIERWDEPKFRM